MTEGQVTAGEGGGEGKPTVENETIKGNTACRQKRSPRWPYVVIPYFIGIVWHGLHPIASVFTGDFSAARRWYIDESSLDPNHFRMNHKYDLLKSYNQHHRESTSSSLCHILVPKHQHRIDCHRIESRSLEVARVVPTSNAISPVSEAIVIVIPSAKNWYESQFHYSILQLLHRLSSSDVSPWLAKTIFVVTSTSTTETSLQDTVDSFLNLYLGSDNERSPFSSTTNHTTLAASKPELEQLLPEFTGAIIRQLIVLEAKQQTTTSTTELRILSQGRRGVLPNMDLVFLCTTVYSRSSYLSRIPHTMHPYQSQVNEWLQYLSPKIPNSLHNWLKQLMNLLAFEYTLLFGGIQDGNNDNNQTKNGVSLPHASALDRGIDSLTIQAVFNDGGGGGGTGSISNNANSIAELVSKMEPVVRGLSNLYERLHHSTSLYLLISPERFVKHEEYLVPNLLLLVPFAVRAVTLIFYDISRFQLKPVQHAFSLVIQGILIVSFGLALVDWLAEKYDIFPDRVLAHQTVVAAAYLPILQACVNKNRPKVAANTNNSLRSVQFAACLMAVYIHVPIAFGHVSLAVPSALLFAPLIAFPSYNRQDNNTQGLVRTILRWGIFFCTCPFSFLVPRIFPDYTPYVIYGYIPLHLLASLLLLSD